MAPTYGKGLMLQLVAWFIMINAFAYTAHPVSRFLETSSISSWTLLLPFIIFFAGAYLIKVGGDIKAKDTTVAGRDED